MGGFSETQLLSYCGLHLVLHVCCRYRLCKRCRCLEWTYCASARRRRIIQRGEQQEVQKACGHTSPIAPLIGQHRKSGKKHKKKNLGRALRIPVPAHETTYISYRQQEPRDPEYAQMITRVILTQQTSRPNLSCTSPIYSPSSSCVQSQWAS